MSKQLRYSDEKGYKLGFRGPYGGNVGTVGGSTSINSIGYAASKYGPAPDSTVSLEVVLANGEVIQTGTGWNTTAQIFSRYSTYNYLTGLFIGFLDNCREERSDLRVLSKESGKERFS